VCSRLSFDVLRRCTLVVYELVRLTGTENRTWLLKSPVLCSCRHHRHSDGDTIVVRYADDTTVAFHNEADARRFLDDLRVRLAKFELELHPEKTRLIPFGRYAKADRPGAGTGGLGTFDFLGFTHICAKSHDGKFLLKRQTMRKRMWAKLAEIKEAMRHRLHQRIAEQGRWLKSVVAATSPTTPYR
jgi:RNA-directed DNA polymerase